MQKKSPPLTFVFFKKSARDTEDQILLALCSLEHIALLHVHALCTCRTQCEDWNPNEN